MNAKYHQIGSGTLAVVLEGIIIGQSKMIQV
jgi:hypothetical protein